MSSSSVAVVLRFPPLAPLPSALWVSRVRPGASWGPSLPSRCCCLADGLEDQDADRSNPDAAVCGSLPLRPNLFPGSFHQNTFRYGPLFSIPSCRLAMPPPFPPPGCCAAARTPRPSPASRAAPPPISSPPPQSPPSLPSSLLPPPTAVPLSPHRFPAPTG